MIFFFNKNDKILKSADSVFDYYWIQNKSLTPFLHQVDHSKMIFLNDFWNFASSIMSKINILKIPSKLYLVPKINSSKKYFINEIRVRSVSQTVEKFTMNILICEVNAIWTKIDWYQKFSKRKLSKPDFTEKVFRQKKWNSHYWEWFFPPRISKQVPVSFKKARNVTKIMTHNIIFRYPKMNKRCSFGSDKAFSSSVWTFSMFQRTAR